MKRPEGLATRVLAVSLFGVLFGGILMFFSVAYTVAEMAMERNLAVNQDLHQYRVAQCLDDPPNWALWEDGQQVYAYDASTHGSVNPDAPPLDRQLLAELQSSSETVVMSVDFPPLSGRALVRFGPPGPCELLGLRWTTPKTNRLRGAGLLSFVQLVLLVFAGVLAIFVAIRPLLRRIEVLARRAVKIGDAEAFEAASDHADDALGQLARRLDESHHRIVAANDALHRRARALEEHLENLAHDIRTPLAALQLRLEDLRGTAEATPTRERLTASIDDVVYMTQLVENLRLASRLEHGLSPSEHEREVDLGEILRRVVQRFALLGELREVKVRGSWPDAPLLITCDAAAVEQALANLAHNAVLHASSEFTLRLDALDSGFELAVIDDGPGVALESLPRLTERGFREDRARSRGPRGSGLGLAIVSEVCRRFGWTIEVDNLEPPGLEVVIRSEPCDQAQPNSS